MNYKIAHTCIRVKDIEKFPASEFDLVFISDDSGLYEIELTYNYNRQEAYELGNGFSHIGVLVEELEESREEHIKKGYKVSELMGLPGSKPRYYFISDPDGYEIEVIRASNE